MADDKLTPAQQLHQAAMQLKQELDTARQAGLEESHGRDVGGLRLPVLREGEYRLPADNVPTQPHDKK